ncbi:MAG: hypothetical protein B6I30_06105 [Desulfobacteraceae bacterium 4572_187]|nr:MAG: hypothetical protein B6I30_06105 [Desulfobacteraceae bacterium 4572_187]
MNSNSTDPKEIRKFGWVALIFFGSIFSLCLWLKKPFSPYFFGFLTLLGAGFVMIPVGMKPVYSIWLRIGHLIGRVITTIMLTLCFYLVMTPAGLLKRVFGGRPLPVKPDKNAVTYWVKRSEPAQPIDRFIKRY